MLVHEAVFRAATERSSQPAVICDGQPITYGAFTLSVACLAERLQIEPGARVLVMLDDKVRYLIAFYAVMTAGGVAVPLAESAGDDTKAEVLAHAQPSAAITGTKTATKLAAALERGRVVAVPFDALSSGSAIPKSHLDAQDADAPALLLYTSGTSSKRKGVLLSHRSLVQASRNINEFMSTDETIREYVTVPLTHSFGLGRARCVLGAGGTLVVHNGYFNAAAMLQSLNRHACNALSWVPSGVALSLGRFEQELRAAGPRILWMELGSEPMAAEQKRFLLEIFPEAHICMHYGLTEASRSTFLDLRADTHKLDTVGRPSPHVEIAVLDEAGEIQGPGTNGEIAVRGAHVMVGYWRDPNLNDGRLTETGFLRTGDYGFLDEEGYLHLLGRQDELINMGGIKISPAEVEEAVRRAVPGLECCVIAIPDPERVMGQVPALCYVNTDGPPLRLAHLHKLIGTRLERTKYPRVLYGIPEIPRTANGKVRRKELLDRLLLVA